MHTLVVNVSGLCSAIIGMFLPFVPNTVSNGCVRGAMERGGPGHARLLQAGSVACVHCVRALHVPVPVRVGETAVLDFDGGARLPPQMLRRLQSRLSFPGNRQSQGKALFRAWWWFHHSAVKPTTSVYVPKLLTELYGYMFWTKAQRLMFLWFFKVTTSRTVLVWVEFWWASKMVTVFARPVIHKALRGGLFISLNIL